MQNTDIQKYFDNLLKESQDWAKNSLPKIVGREAVAHFKENFDSGTGNDLTSVLVGQ